jgi:hypothetical protein
MGSDITEDGSGLKLERPNYLKWPIPSLEVVSKCRQGKLKPSLCFCREGWCYKQPYDLDPAHLRNCQEWKSRSTPEGKRHSTQKPVQC